MENLNHTTLGLPRCSKGRSSSKVQIYRIVQKRVIPRENSIENFSRTSPKNRTIPNLYLHRKFNSNMSSTKISAEPPLKIGLSQIYTYMENIILIYSVTTTNATRDPTIVYPQLKYT